MLLQNRNVFSITVGLLGALKLILQAFGYNILTDQEVNDIANGVAAVVTVIGVIMTHLRRHEAQGSGGVAESPRRDSGPAGPAETGGRAGDLPAEQPSSEPGSTGQASDDRGGS
ncbi:MAG: hypothetical protein K6T30_01335 [Alicyclobacillus sp.]|nr:hypothetical protein [Alicyclobacillus sp.]